MLSRARRIQGKFEEALGTYDEIVREYPQEIRAYLDMLDIAINDLRDAARAESISRMAVAALKDPHARERVRNRLREGLGI